MCICLTVKHFNKISFIYMCVYVSQVSASQLIYFNAKNCILKKEMLMLYACANFVINIWSILIVSGSGWELLRVQRPKKERRFATFKKSYLFYLIHSLKQCGNKGLFPLLLPCTCFNIMSIFFIFLPIFHTEFQMLVLCFGMSKY